MNRLMHSFTSKCLNLVTNCVLCKPRLGTFFFYVAFVFCLLLCPCPCAVCYSLGLNEVLQRATKLAYCALQLAQQLVCFQQQHGQHAYAFILEVYLAWASRQYTSRENIASLEMSACIFAHFFSFLSDSCEMKHKV